MKIVVIGTGFVGVVSACVYAHLGHDVIGLDVDEKKVEMLRAGKVPFFEPDLENLLKETTQSGNLHFTTSYADAITDAALIVIAVGTPSAPDGQADLTYVFSAIDSMSRYLCDGAIIAIKSTVPPGTNTKVETHVSKLRPDLRISIASLPEFLREGSAVHDTLHPDRIVIGAHEKETITLLEKLHKPLCKNILVMKSESAQMAKYSANAYLATRITFINQIANLCERNGANILEVIKAIGEDTRIGDHYWYPGLAYGGSCFPKDVKELAAYARSVAEEDNLMVTINRLNEERIPKIFARLEKIVGGFAHKKVALLGLSFKPNTDDMREAPSTKLVPFFLHAQATIMGYDPMANEQAKKYFGANIQIADDISDVLQDADCVCVLVEWKEFCQKDPAFFAGLVKKGAYFFDARDQWKREEVEKKGLKYIGIGV